MTVANAPPVLESPEAYQEWWDSQDKETQWAEYIKNMAILARDDDSPSSFASFYELVTGKPPPRHVIEEWITPLYEAREGLRGLVIEAFRGSTKTTTLTNLYTAYRIGKEPQKANLIIQVADETASDNGLEIASIIEYNPGFQLCFPNVVPDRERGWGASGYEVKRDDIEYSQWQALNAGRHDPTLMSVSYKSRAIIGRHPDGLLIVDDIHDENNTSSDRELARVLQILTGTIFPTISAGETQVIFVGTPWVDNDALHYAAATGEFEHIKTPVYREVDGETIYTWPEKFGPEEVERQKNLADSVEFARMFLLDLSASKNKVYNYQLYPSSEIRFTWPIVAGVDYAGSMDEWKNKAGINDYFAIAIVAKLPGGGAVVVDGVLEHCTQAEAENYLVGVQQMYDDLGTYIYAVVEGDGRGEDFIQVVKRNPGMKIVPMKTGGKSKDNRLVKQMSPWLASGMVRVSDAETPFLRQLRRELDRPESVQNDDARDALYWALRGMPEVLNMPMDDDELPNTKKKKRAKNPFSSLGAK
jgi:hypothetical protein